MRAFHTLILQKKHWQVFLIMTCLIVLVGYPLYLLGKHTFSWQMSFLDSPVPGCTLYLGFGFWLDAVLTLGERRLARILSPILLALNVCTSYWLKYSPYGMILFLPSIAIIAFVLVPAAKAIHAIDRRQSSQLLILLDTILIGCYFPFGVWILQPRLNNGKAVLT